MSALQVKRFIPFSVGPRDCIGQNLAKVNYQTTVPMLLSQFSFKLADEVSPCHQSCSKKDLDQPGLSFCKSFGSAVLQDVEAVAQI